MRKTLLSLLKSKYSRLPHCICICIMKVPSGSCLLHNVFKNFVLLLWSISIWPLCPYQCLCNSLAWDARFEIDDKTVMQSEFCFSQLHAQCSRARYLAGILQHALLSMQYAKHSHIIEHLRWCSKECWGKLAHLCPERLAIPILSHYS